MSNTQQLLIRISADTRQANEGLRTISDQFKRVGDSTALAADRVPVVSAGHH